MKANGKKICTFSFSFVVTLFVIYNSDSQATKLTKCATKMWKRMHHSSSNASKWWFRHITHDHIIQIRHIYMRVYINTSTSTYMFTFILPLINTMTYYSHKKIKIAYYITTYMSWIRKEVKSIRIYNRTHMDSTNSRFFFLHSHLSRNSLHFGVGSVGFASFCGEFCVVRHPNIVFKSGSAPKALPLHHLHRPELCHGQSKAWAWWNASEFKIQPQSNNDKNWKNEKSEKNHRITKNSDWYNTCKHSLELV